MMKQRMMMLITLLMTALLQPWAASAQMIEDAAKWSAKITNNDKGEATITFTAKMKSGWHVYDTNMPDGGPTPTSLEWDGAKGMKAVGVLTPDRKADEVYDENFGMTLRWFGGEVSFVQKVQINDPENFKIAGDIVYMVCNNQTCLPPERYAFAFDKKELTTPITAAVAAPAEATESTETPAETSAEGQEEETAAPAVEAAPLDSDALWTPVVEELKAYGDKTLSAADNSLWMIFIFGFLGGLVALLTPCVWPMIPMTVSFFLKRTKSRSKAIRDALIYGAAIVVIYLTLGLLITGVFGASVLNDLSTSALFNIIFFLLLVFFAISFFGAFELVLPQSWTNKLDEKADSTTGLLSIFFMAFTLVLVSFSCTGPIIGTLLVEAATMGNMVGPAVGMFGFALALAIPFAFFAIFPNFLQSMPRSGGWLNSVKVVLGFLELALALKFLSVADLAYGWRILDREVFLVLWITIFTLLGLYLLGKLKLSHDSDLPYVSVPRLFMSIISFGFALYMVPGLWGAPLKSISAFAPPSYTQDFNLYNSEVHAKFDDYESAVAYARQHNKPLMIDFSGFGCVNCRKMEASVWIDPKVKSMLENDFVLVTLMVDDKSLLPAPIEVNDGGSMRLLKTIGEKWSYFQRYKFAANAQPFYVMLDGEGKPLGPSYGFNENVADYIAWLNSGLKEYAARK